MTAGDPTMPWIAGSTKQVVLRKTNFQETYNSLLIDLLCQLYLNWSQCFPRVH